MTDNSPTEIDLSCTTTHVDVSVMEEVYDFMKAERALLEKFFGLNPYVYNPQELEDARQKYKDWVRTQFFPE
jgi:hypothetical protein